MSEDKDTRQEVEEDAKEDLELEDKDADQVAGGKISGAKYGGDARADVAWK